MLRGYVWVCPSGRKKNRPSLAHGPRQQPRAKGRASLRQEGAMSPGTAEQDPARGTRTGLFQVQAKPRPTTCRVKINFKAPASHTSPYWGILLRRRSRMAAGQLQEPQSRLWPWENPNSKCHTHASGGRSAVSPSPYLCAMPRGRQNPGSPGIASFIRPGPPGLQGKVGTRAHTAPGQR